MGSHYLGRNEEGRREKEQEGALGQRNIVILVGVLNDFDSVSALLVAVVGVLSGLK